MPNGQNMAFEARNQVFDTYLAMFPIFVTSGLVLVHVLHPHFLCVFPYHDDFAAIWKP